MWWTPSSTARRSTATASSWSRGGPMTPGPGSCIAPNPTRCTVNGPKEYVSMPLTLAPFAHMITATSCPSAEPTTEAAANPLCQRCATVADGPPLVSVGWTYEKATAARPAPSVDDTTYIQ